MRDVRSASGAMFEVTAAVLLALFVGTALRPVIVLLTPAWGEAIGKLVVFLLPSIIVTMASRDRFVDSYACRRLSLRDGAVSALAAPAAFAVLMGVLVAQDCLFREWGISIEADRKAFETHIEQIASDGALVLALAIVVLPAICEELLFRGFLQTRFVRAFGRTPGCLIVAMLFGAMHQPVDRMVPMILFGILLGFLVLRTGSVWSAMIVHGLHNGIIALLSFGDVRDAERLPVSTPLLGLAALVLTVGYLIARGGPDSGR